MSGAWDVFENFRSENGLSPPSEGSSAPCPIRNAVIRAVEELDVVLVVRSCVGWTTLVNKRV